MSTFIAIHICPKAKMYLIYLRWLPPDILDLFHGLLLCVPRVPEPGPEREDPRARERGIDLDEAEEGVVLDAALPQVLARLAGGGLKAVGALVILKQGRHQAVL
jgi:hypothetical protein